jgi:poly-gamma-glutamate synthesis protein (capsule biosynthesis protein)
MSKLHAMIAADRGAGWIESASSTLTDRSPKPEARNLETPPPWARVGLRYGPVHMTDTKQTGVFEIPEAIRTQMRGKSWRDDPACPSFEALRLLKLPYRDFADVLHVGELVVHVEVADEVARIFAQLCAAGFPIHSMQRIDHFAADDELSMAANNTSGFNFRVIQGTSVLSQHALGLAIDINPAQNPWLRPGRVDPEAGRDYLDRTQRRPGMIVRPSPVLDAFAAFGWQWGGAPRRPDDGPDYHHFSKR